MKRVTKLILIFIGLMGTAYAVYMGIVIPISTPPSFKNLYIASMLVVLPALYKCLVIVYRELVEKEKK